MTNHGRSLLFGTLASLVLAVPGVAQTSTGSIVGRIVDAKTGAALTGAQVAVAGTQRGALSGVDGRYLILNVPAGTRNIQVTYIGYATKTVEGVVVVAGQSAVQNISIESSAIEVAGITVSATKENGTVAAALNQQRTAVGVISGTTQDQIAKSPDSDAAQAVKRVSGVTVQDGKYVFVRGLGERYTTTSLNGARVPSPEPEKKVVPLDLFPSSLLESITTSKTFTPDQPGDFSGAEVNLKTRSFPAHRMVQLSLSTAYNTLATGKDILTPPTSGGEWLAMAAGNRALPSQLTSVTNFATLTQKDINAIVRALPRNWESTSAAGAPNVSGGLSFGGNDPLLGHDIGYIGSLSYSRSEEVHSGEIRARAVAGDSLGTPKPYNTFVGGTGQSSVLWGGLLNLSTYIGRNNKIRFNNTYDRSGDNSAHLDWGHYEEFAQVDSMRRTQISYVERTVRSNQLSGEHQIGDHNKVTWSVTSSRVTRKQPDRSDLAYGYEIAPTGERLPLAWLGYIYDAGKRTSADLKEDALSGSLDYALRVGGATFKVGGAYRQTKRDSKTASYNLIPLGLNSAQRAATPEQIFDGQYTEGDQAHILLAPNSAGGDYNATDDVSAGYAMAEIPVGSRIRVIGGARMERWKLDMDAEPVDRGTINITRDNKDVLPSLAVNAKLSGNQTLRLSATQTLSRPEYREMAPISYRDMVGEREVFGDSSLVRTKVQNYDARWEWYPRLNEVVSVALFAKHFDRPIEQIDVATSGVSQLSYINAQSADNYGVEFELRKGLAFLGDGLAPFGIFSNVTLMKSTINTSNSTLSAQTNDKRPMVGQAPYVVNAGLAYTSPSGGTSATVLYNVVGKRISAAALEPVKVDTYEQPRKQLDLSLRFDIRDGMTGKLDATNLLDSPYEELQGDVVRYRYTLGRSLGFGVSWALR